MSHNQFSATGFPVKQQISEQKIRNIVKDQVFDILLTIKDQIQNKVKQIDISICQLRNKISIVQQKTEKLGTLQQTINQKKIDQVSNQLKEITKKVETLQIMQSQIKQFQQNSILSRNRSTEKMPILKKANTSANLSKILFGDQAQGSVEILDISPIKISNNQFLRKRQSPNKNEHIINQDKKVQKTKVNSKPPLPTLKNEGKITSDARVKSQSSINYAQQQKLLSFNPQTNQEQGQKYIDNRILQSLNRNKNSFMRKKSQQNINSNQRNLNINVTPKFDSKSIQSHKNFTHRQQWRQTIQEQENQSSISIDT